MCRSSTYSATISDGDDLIFVAISPLDRIEFDAETVQHSKNHASKYITKNLLTNKQIRLHSYNQVELCSYSHADIKL